MSRRAILILGASGFLGRSLCHYFQAKNVDIFPVARDLQQLPELLSKLSKKPDAIVLNLIGLVDVKKCAEDPEQAFAVNRDIAVFQAKQCRDYGMRFIHISTDSLFPNLSPDTAPKYWSLSDPTDPPSVYAQSKLAAEAALQELNWGECWRLSFVGPSLGSRKGLIAHVARAIQANTPLSGYKDNFFTPLHSHQIAKFLLERPLDLITKEFSLRQLATDRAITKYDFLASMLASVGSSLAIRAVNRREEANYIPATLDQSMKSDFPFSTDEMLTLSAQSLRLELIK